MTSTPNLSRWLDGLHLAGCTCPYEYKSLGYLYRVSLGKGWVRMKDAPDCPHHARDRRRREE